MIRSVDDDVFEEGEPIDVVEREYATGTPFVTRRPTDGRTVDGDPVTGGGGLWVGHATGLSITRVEVQRGVRVG